MKKKKIPFGKKVKNVKRIAGMTKGATLFYTQVLPWILVGFAAVAYVALNVPVPERKIKEKYKETW